MASMSRRLSRTLTRVLLKREREVIERFVSLSVRTVLFISESVTDLLRRCIGKGNHSENHMAKIKPTIEELVQEYDFAEFATYFTHSLPLGIIFLQPLTLTTRVF